MLKKTLGQTQMKAIKNIYNGFSIVVSSFGCNISLSDIVDIKYTLTTPVEAERL